MSRTILFSLALAFWFGVAAQVSAIRLAILTTTPELNASADLAMAEFSQNEHLQLLERQEIERIFREQQLSQANLAKQQQGIGKILGADGLLILDLSKEGTNAFLNARLIAVDPGAVLDFVKTPWPNKFPADWSGFISKRLSPLLPKLSVLKKDSLPISVVNFRSTLNSAESKEMERAVTSLLINRLSIERELFVLERRKMDALAAEKEFKNAEEISFWNGSYLIEGTIDRNGYSEKIMTVDAHVAPPNGGTPIRIHVSGDRHNPSAIVEQLAEKILESLHRDSTAREWKQEEEAAKFFEEANWALKWGMMAEAQSAADSAWALNKCDMDCAITRVRSYMPEPVSIFGNSSGTSHAKDYASFFEPSASKHAAILTETDKTEARFVSIDRLPKAKDLDLAIHSLELYSSFSRTISPDSLQPKSPWYLLGIDALNAASVQLQNFYFIEPAQKELREKLAQLRSLSRFTAEWILKSPSIRGSYWVENRIATHDDLANTIEGENIFRCKMKWGRFWQEKPEDVVALYRELLSSDVFTYIHSDLWQRDLKKPRLTAWNEKDQERIPDLWRDFISELSGSTNALLNIEAKFLQLADAETAKQPAAFTNFFETIFQKRESLVSNNVEVLYEEMGISRLMSFVCRDNVFQTLYFKEYYPRLREMNQQYRDQISQRKNAEAQFAKFLQQKEFLQKLVSYGSSQFDRLFSGSDYTLEQARELEPLMLAYKNSLLAQIKEKSGAEAAALKRALRSVQDAERDIHAAALPQEKPAAQKNNSPGSIRIKMPAAPELVAQQSQLAITNVIQVKDFFAIPTQQLEGEKTTNFGITVSRIRDGNAWFLLTYTDVPDHETWDTTRHMSAIVQLNLNNFTWRFFTCPGHVENGMFLGRPSDFEVAKGLLFLSDFDGIKRYNESSRTWEKLKIPEHKPGKLFTIGDRLFFSNTDNIWEIANNGDTVRILANCRRRPAASALDSMPSLNTPPIFAGPEDSIRTVIDKKIFFWDEQDWREIFTLPNKTKTHIREGGAIFRWDYLNTYSKFWLFPRNQTDVKLYFEGMPEKNPSFDSGFISRPTSTNSIRPTWAAPDVPLSEASEEFVDDTLYFFREHKSLPQFGSEKRTNLVGTDGSHANLVCFAPGNSNAFVIPLSFDLSVATLPEYQPGPHFYWLRSSGKHLVLGHAGVPGCWLIPKDKVDEQIRIESQRRKQADEQRRVALWEKFGLEGTGAFDTNKVMKSQDISEFLEAQWTIIDTNHNNFLDPMETIFFDFNQNGLLDPDEITALKAMPAIIAPFAFLLTTPTKMVY